MDELEQLIVRSDSSSSGGSSSGFSLKGSGLSTDESLTMLKRLRTSRISRPDIVYRVGMKLLDGGYVKSGEIWSIFEQVLIASLQMGDLETARRYHSKLEIRFNSKNGEESSRVKKLEAMILEAEACHFGDSAQQALDVFDDILKKNAANLPVLKRKASLLRTAGRQKEAITALHEIIKLYSGDLQVWGELAEMHIEAGDLEAGAFALEEMVLLNPLCVAYHTRLGECYFSLGSPEQLVNARKHFSVSLNHQAANLNKRALYGLAATCRRVLEIEEGKLPGGAQDHRVSERLLEWCGETMHDTASGVGVPEIVGVVAKILA